MKPFLVTCIKEFYAKGEGLNCPSLPQVGEIYIVIDMVQCDCCGQYNLYELGELRGWGFLVSHFRELKPLDIDNIIEEGSVGIDWEAGRLVDLKEFEKAYNTKG